jgi:hypothetical protein
MHLTSGSFDFYGSNAFRVVEGKGRKGKNIEI